jgi:hypothetical protein
MGPPTARDGVNPVAVSSVGSITPAAGDADGSVGCMYVEARRYDNLPKVCEQDIPLVGARTPIPDNVVGLDRLVSLGSEALWDAVTPELAGEPIGLVVCAPSEVDEPAMAGQSDVLLSRLATEAEVSLAPRASRVFSRGRSSIFEALPFALGSIMRPELAAVCVLGVDSLVTKTRLRRFLEQGGATGSGLPLPGEAGAAVVLTRMHEPSALAVLLGLGVTNDRFPDQEGPSHPGKGMITAIDRATAEAEVERPMFSGLVCDEAGTSNETEELAWAKTSNAFMHSPAMETVLPYVATADAGAAMGPLALATTAFLLHRAAWAAPALCCFCAPGQRGAAILAPSSRRRQKGAV